MTMTTLPRRLLLALCSATALALPLAGCQRAAPAPAFHAVDITGAKYAQDFALPDADGRIRHLSDFKGKVTVVFFGYTQCPDVCPTTMADLAQAKQLLGPDGDRVQGVFITVDPERDTPSLLKAYVKNFDPSFVALRGTPAQTEATAKAFKVFYAKVPGSDDKSYTVDHTAGAYVFDPQGRVRLFTRYGSGPKALADDVKQLLAQG
jgi:protein SCO1/2